MIGSKLGHAAFRLGMFVVVVSGFLLWFTEPDTAGNVISLFMLIVGLLFLIIVAILVRAGRRI